MGKCPMDSKRGPKCPWGVMSVYSLVTKLVTVRVLFCVCIPYSFLPFLLIQC